ncbi:MAG: hypothetical protein ABNH21_02340, partial [Glaciecola sp.]
LVASKQKRGSSNDLGWLFVCNKHITLIIIVDEYLRLNDNIWIAIDTRITFISGKSLTVQLILSLHNTA